VVYKCPSIGSFDMDWSADPPWWKVGQFTSNQDQNGLCPILLIFSYYWMHVTTRNAFFRYLSVWPTCHFS